MQDIKPLSYSSSNLVKNCQQKYWHYKVKATPKDPDADDSTEAFDIGKAFHEVLELNGHTTRDLESLLDDVCKKYEVDHAKNMIHAMLLRYLQVHIQSGLDVLFCEVKIQTPDTIGFVDVVLGDGDGNWWVGDMKTAGRFSNTTLAKLSSDPQLNLYCYHLLKMAKFLKLDPKKFKGARYRVTTKSKLVQKARETDAEHIKRTAKNVKSYDIIIPKEIMCIEETYKKHVHYFNKAVKLQTGEEAPEQNFTYCDSYFRPCEYWSKCHGHTYSDGLVKLEMVKSSNA